MSWCTFFPFYFMSWEQLHTGQMFLPLINGPSEGLVIAGGMGIVTYARGAAWWHVEWLVDLVPIGDALGQVLGTRGPAAVALAAAGFRNCRDVAYASMALLPQGLVMREPALEPMGTVAHALVFSPLSGFLVFMVLCVAATVASHMVTVFMSCNNVKQVFTEVVLCNTFPKCQNQYMHGSKNPTLGSPNCTWSL